VLLVVLLDCHANATVSQFNQVADSAEKSARRAASRSLRCIHSGVARNLFRGEQIFWPWMPSPFPSSFTSSPFPSPFPSIPLPFLLEVGPIIAARSGGVRKLPQRGRAEPAEKRLLVHFKAIWMQLLASIFMQFVLGKFLGRSRIFAADSSDQSRSQGGSGKGPCPPPS